MMLSRVTSLKWPIAMWGVLSLTCPAWNPYRKLALVRGWESLALLETTSSKVRESVTPKQMAEVTDHDHDKGNLEVSDLHGGNSFCPHTYPGCMLVLSLNFRPHLVQIPLLDLARGESQLPSSFLFIILLPKLFCFATVYSNFSQILYGHWESAPQTSHGRAKYVGATGKTAPYGSCLITKQKMQFFWKLMSSTCLENFFLLLDTAGFFVHCSCPPCPEKGNARHSF